MIINGLHSGWISQVQTVIILKSGENTQHDKKIEGLTSAIHQIDGVVDGVAVEAKDHAAGQKMHAVGIGEIRNFEAAICDIKEIVELSWK